MAIDLKTEQMISLVLQINGYARADDLQALPSAQRTVALRSYYQDHAGTNPLHWRGEQLWAGSGTPVPATFSNPSSAAQSVVPSVTVLHGPGIDAPAADPFGDLMAAPSGPATAVATIDTALDPTAFDDTFSAGPALSQAEAPLLIPLSAEPITASLGPIASPVDTALEPDYLPEPTGMFATGSPQIVMPSDSAVNPLWWLLAILWAPIGGVIAYVVLKGANPAGAGKLLKVSLIVWGAYIVLAVVLGAVVALSLA